MADSILVTSLMRSKIPVGEMIRKHMSRPESLMRRWVFGRKAASWAKHGPNRQDASQRSRPGENGSAGKARLTRGRGAAKLAETDRTPPRAGRTRRAQMWADVGAFLGAVPQHQDHCRQASENGLRPFLHRPFDQLGPLELEPHAETRHPIGVQLDRSLLCRLFGLFSWDGISLEW